MVSWKSIRIEDKKIEIVKQWPVSHFVRDIQAFSGFANFYQRFIQGFNWIAVPLTSLLKTSGSIESKTRPGEGRVGVGGSRARREGNKLDKSKLHNDEVDGGEVGDNKVVKSKKTGSGFFISGARKAFTKLRQTFIKAPILHHFDPERHIRVEMDVSGYAIGGILSQLILDNLVQWHLVAFFSKKMIPAETRYETQDDELLAIVEAFKTWRHYLKWSQHEVLVFTDYNNLRRFMKTKSLSSRQVRWAQELFCYQFQIDYCQGKANGAANALF